MQPSTVNKLFVFFASKINPRTNSLLIQFKFPCGFAKWRPTHPTTNNKTFLKMLNVYGWA
jgi:hypothetical protein